jgi:large-conductance mechanosensitive channel
MNHRKIVFNIIAIIAALTLLVPLFNFVADVMNLESDVAYFGPIIAFLGAFLVGWIVVSLSIKSYNQLKSSEECQKKATGKSSKKKENNKK